MRLITPELSLDADLIVLDKDGTIVEMDGHWLRRATWWEDAIESASNMSGLGAIIAERVGHDRDTDRIVPGSTLASGTLVDLRTVVGKVLRDAGADAGLASLVGPSQEGVVTAKGEVRRWMEHAKQLGAAIAVLTSDDRAPTRYELGRLGIAHLVDEMVAADDGHPAKPNPAGLIALCDHLGVAPQRTVMIGDSAADMLAALGASVRRIGIRSDNGTAPRGAEAVVRLLHDIELAP